jgi:hypothetical protein
LCGAALPNPASASIVYSLSGSADFQNFLDPNPGSPDIESFSFVYTVPSFITSDVTAASIPGCSISGVFGCTGASFNIWPSFGPGTGADIISLEFTTPGGGSGGGTLVFTPGALAAVGTYAAITDSAVQISQDPDAFAGSFGSARLTVSDYDTTTPLPAALPLFASGLGAFGWLARRRKFKNAAVIAVT